LRSLAPEVLAREVAPFVAKRGLDVPATDARLLAAAPLVAPRATTFIDAADALDYFFREPPVFDEKAKAKLLTPEARAQLAALATIVEAVTPFERTALEAAVKTWLEREQIELKTVAQPARVALTGRTASPGLFEVMEVLGRALSLARLRA
jgi:glutamyl-tRNA synthetase